MYIVSRIALMNMMSMIVPDQRAGNYLDPGPSGAEKGVGRQEKN
jgi:hypothetical protein